MICPHCKKEVNASGTKCPECGATLRLSAENLPMGMLIAGFRIEDEIGRGGMGVVYRATQLNLSRPVALKVLSDELSNDAAFVERFFHEARAAACLSHPNIVQAYDAGISEEGVYYFAMEYIDGETLELKLTRNGPLSPHSALELGLHISQALGYAWDTRKMCHGDIKPDNILAGHTGELKLADLGLAKSVYDEEAKRDVMVTPLYAAPEIIAGKVTEPTLLSDIYSFGATMYHVAVGHPPFNSEEIDEIYRRHLTETAVPPSQANSAVPETLSALILRMLEKEPEKRPQSWTEVSEAFQEILDMEHPPVPPSQGNSRKYLLPLLAVLLAAGSVFGLLIFNRTPGPEAKREIPTGETPPAPNSSATPKTVGPNLEKQQEQKLRIQWKRLKQSLKNEDPYRKVSRLNSFLKKRSLPEDLETEVRHALNSAEKEIDRIQKSAAAYSADVDSFCREIRFAPYFDWNRTQTMLNRYQMLIEQGKLPHLQFPFRVRETKLNEAGTLLCMRVSYFSELPQLPQKKTAQVPGRKKTVVPATAPKRPPIASNVTPKEIPNQPAPPSRPSRSEGEEALIALLMRHVRNFQPDILKLQLDGLSRRFRRSDIKTSQKAMFMAEALSEKDALLRLLTKWNNALKGMPLPDFGENSSFLQLEQESLRILQQDGRMMVRRKLRMTPANQRKLKAQLMRSFADENLRKRYPEELQSFIVINSFFYDISNAERNISLMDANSRRKPLLESLYKDIQESIKRVQDKQ